LHRHILYTGVGFFGGAVVEKWRVNRQAEKDLMYYHYMTLHPEDFPPRGNLISDYFILTYTNSYHYLFF